MTQKTSMDMDHVYHLYVTENLSYTVIGKRYGCTPSTVGNRLKTYAQERGMAWPLKPYLQTRANNVDSVRCDLIVGEIHDCIRNYRINQVRLAEVCGLSANLLYQITSGFKPRIHRRTAVKIEKGISRVERGLVKWEQEGVRLPMAIRTHCDKGHPYVGRMENGMKKCVVCRAEKDRRGWDRKWQQKQDEAMAAWRAGSREEVA